MGDIEKEPHLVDESGPSSSIRTHPSSDKRRHSRSHSQARSHSHSYSHSYSHSQSHDAEYDPEHDLHQFDLMHAPTRHLTGETQSLDGHPLHRHTSLTRVISTRPTISDATSLASIDRPPSISAKTELPLPPAKVYHPFSPHVLALLFPASIFGVLTRLGIQALVGYDGKSIFALAWVQAVGCFVMGIGLGIKDPLGQL